LMGVCIPLFNIAAVWPMARHTGSGFLRELARNPLIIATAAGLQFGHLSQAKALAVSVLTIKHLAMPLAAMGLARAFRLSFEQTTILLAFSALPTASSAYVLAARMGYSGALVAGLVTLPTMLGVVSLTFALGVLR
jgi:malonate transporter and related proteins